MLVAVQSWLTIQEIYFFAVFLFHFLSNNNTHKVVLWNQLSAPSDSDSSVPFHSNCMHALYFPASVSVGWIPDFLFSICFPLVITSTQIIIILFLIYFIQFCSIYDDLPLIKHSGIIKWFSVTPWGRVPSIVFTE